MGFVAIATSSGAHANTLGRHDGRVSRDEAIAYGRALAAAVEVPVSADREGIRRCPRGRAETIRRAGEAGVAGGSIEDAAGTVCASVSRPVTGVRRVRLATSLYRAITGLVAAAREIRARRLRLPRHNARLRGAGAVHAAGIGATSNPLVSLWFSPRAPARRLVVPARP